MSEIIFVIHIFALFLISLSIIYNTALVVRKYTIDSGTNKESIRVIFLADLFSNKHNIGISRIIDKVRKCNPDIIIASGNILPEYDQRASAILRELSSIATVYSVFSNAVCEESCEKISNGEIKILKSYSILAISGHRDYSDELLTFSKLENVKILLCEKPELFNPSVYSKDIFLSISSHGGGLMLRIPFYGIVDSSSQGFLPAYPLRYYNINGRKLIVTTGVGKSRLPLRVNNMREIPCIDIK